MVAVDAGLLMFGGVASGDQGTSNPFTPECWLLQLGPSPLLGLKDNEVISSCFSPFVHSVNSDILQNDCLLWHACTTMGRCVHVSAAGIIKLWLSVQLMHFGANLHCDHALWYKDRLEDVVGASKV